MTAPSPDLAPSRVTAVLILALCGGLASIGSWMALPRTEGVFVVPENLRPVSGGISPPGALAAERTRELKEGALQCAIIGACSGALLGLGMGLAVRSTRGAVLGLLAGAVVTGAVGSLGGLVVVRLFRDMPHFTIPLVDLSGPTPRAMVAHVALWSVLSVGVALAAGVATRRAVNIPKALLAGVVAGVVGAALVQVLATAIFMAARTERPVPTDSPTHLVRILWVGLWSVTYGLALGRVLVHGSPTAPTSPASPRPAVPADGTAGGSPPGSTRTA